ncbi:hypothetical protein HPB47_000596 [Ixodes persulcatus]|uniref:Uncharacterized protein n=1 Tax=Ixodes persulcatus TaxID=34615 RepID=A0AC60PSK6_IXOPE|nr:hypothetical protein HPB47_000596 [Ixodes persulcatus]
MSQRPMAPVQVTTLPDLNASLPNFSSDGGISARHWIEELERTQLPAFWDPSTLLAVALRKLRGPAADWKVVTDPKLKLISKCPVVLTDVQRIEYAIQGVQDGHLATSIAAQRPPTVATYMGIVTEYDRTLSHSILRPSRAENSNAKPPVAKPYPASTQSSLAASISDRADHMPATPSRISSLPPDEQDARYLTITSRHGAPAYRPGQDLSNAVCYNCRQNCHLSAKCTEARTSRNQQPANSKANTPSMSCLQDPNSLEGSLIQCEVIQADIPAIGKIDAFPDSGFKLTILSHDVVKSSSLLPWTKPPIAVVGSGTVVPSGTLRTRISVGPISGVVEVVVLARNPLPLILGEDWFEAAHAELVVRPPNPTEIRHPSTGAALLCQEKVLPRMSNAVLLCTTNLPSATPTVPVTGGLHLEPLPDANQPPSYRTPDNCLPLLQPKRETAQTKAKPTGMTIHRSQDVPESDLVETKAKKPLRITTAMKQQTLAKNYILSPADSENDGKFRSVSVQTRTSDSPSEKQLLSPGTETEGSRSDDKNEDSTGKCGVPHVRAAHPSKFPQYKSEPKLRRTRRRPGALIWTLGEKVGEKSGASDWQAPRSSADLANHGRQISCRLFRQVSRLGPQIETRSSRRIQGLHPEHGLLPPRTKQPTRPTMNDQQSQTPASSSIIYLPVTPRTPTTFNGEAHEDIEDWLQHYERVARHNEWTAEQRLQNQYFSLEGTSRHWFENHEASFTTWDGRSLTTTVASEQRTFSKQGCRAPTKAVTSFVEDVMRLCARVYPEAAEEKKLRVLMRGVKAETFGGLVRNPPTTVDGFVAEATNIERALSARASHYHRLAGMPAPPTVASCRLDQDTAGVDGLRQIVRDIVREELRKMLPAADRPSSISLAEVVREEVHRAFQPEVPINTTTPEEPTLSYAAMARRPPQANRQATAPPRRDPPMPQYPRRQEEQVQDVRPEQPSPKKTDVWRTANRRPLCYHCGEADHIYRSCPYRRLGLRGFHPNDPHPRYGERPRDIEEYLRRSPSSVPSLRRESRSPSPRRSASPAPRPRRESLSPLRRREN